MKLIIYKLKLLKRLNHLKDMFSKYKLIMYANEITKLENELRNLEDLS